MTTGDQTKRALKLGFLLSCLVLANYLKSIPELKQQLLVRWSDLDLVTLISLQLFMVLIFAAIFKLFKGPVIAVLPSIFLICFLGLFLHLNLLLILLLIVLLFVLHSANFSFYKKPRQKIIDSSAKLLSALFVMSIVFVMSFYFKIYNAVDFEIMEEYHKPQSELKHFSAKAKNIFFFVFDRLSYQELYLTGLSDSKLNDNKVAERYKNFADFSEHASNYHAVFSPYDQTMKSVPILLGLERDENIFASANAAAYQTRVLGAYLNYCDVVKNVDHCKSYTWYKTKSSLDPFTTSLLRHLLYIPNSGDFFRAGLPLFSNIYRLARDTRAVTMQKNMEADLFALLDKNLEQSFVYTHMLLPHPPYVFSENGADDLQTMIKRAFAYRDPQQKIRPRYIKNLDYLDLSFGKFIAKLKEESLYEDALIIVTSDHSYKGDPAFRDIRLDPHASRLLKNKFKLNQAQYNELVEQDQKALIKSGNKAAKFSKLLRSTHVPLMIKLPGQKTRKDSNKFLSNADLIGGDAKLFKQNFELNTNTPAFMQPRYREDFKGEDLSMNRYMIKELED